jgi:hypothetical protein
MMKIKSLAENLKKKIDGIKIKDTIH